MREEGRKIKRNMQVGLEELEDIMGDKRVNWWERDIIV